jgi:hypothetical protein
VATHLPWRDISRRAKPLRRFSDTRQPDAQRSTDHTHAPYVS